ncbi:unnamed protein product [Plutella xylostella]|uniref:(diamondback moth) hypothetical protein n=1 Tax=Plutella xylostella TaxID=51655 RepID=A0A8S4EX42_PLUXY|nr:unnamed protein product [Plutella xylostella]
MDRFTNSSFEKQTIYEIFRACRLCGAGGGYKMPIIQNVVDLDDTDVELKQKIKECVQIEVHPEDKMPPLICELCIDKINDFYEFLEMCRITNSKTRQKLGLPPQTLEVPDEDNCILGVTEPLYHKDDDDSEDEPLVNQTAIKPKTHNQKGSSKKTPSLTIKKCNVKIENVQKDKKPPPSLTSKQTKSKAALKTYPNDKQTDRHTDNSRRRLRSPSPPPEKRITRNMQESDGGRRRTLDRSSRSSSISSVSESPIPPPKSILKKKEVKVEDPHKLLVVRPNPKKRVAEKESPKPVSKKVKITPPPPPAPKPVTCKICNVQLKSALSMSGHIRTHTPTYTSEDLACNACGEWFATTDEASSHHEGHGSFTNPYKCRVCYGRFQEYEEFKTHYAKDPCLMFMEVPDMRCDDCWFTFPTGHLYEEHKCPGEDGRRGGKCSKCSRSYALLKNQMKHEAVCNYGRKKGQREPIIEPEVKRRLRRCSVRVARCDPLLRTSAGGHYDAAGVPKVYGLDPNSVYPYLRIKREPSDGMVNISYDALDFVHWDSDYSSDDTDDFEPRSKTRKVDSLSTMTLKVLFSKKCLGKIPRKRRKKHFKEEIGFDSILNTTDADRDIKKDIDDIISGLDKAWDDDDDFGEVDRPGSESILNESDEKDVGKETDNICNIDFGLSCEGDTEIKDGGGTKDNNLNDDDTRESLQNTTDNNKNHDDAVSENKDVEIKGSDTDEKGDSQDNTNGSHKDSLDASNDNSSSEVNKDYIKSQTFTQQDSPTFTQQFDGSAETETQKDNDVGENELLSEKNQDSITDNAKKSTETHTSEAKFENNIAGVNEECNIDVSSEINNDKQEAATEANIVEAAKIVSSDITNDSNNVNASNEEKVQENGVNTKNTHSDNIESTTERKDRELMEALDEQISANDNHDDDNVRKENTELCNVKAKTLESNPDMKSMDLDAVSDEEFNFD